MPIDWFLIALFVVTVLNWLVTIALLRLTVIRPLIRSLLERTTLSVVASTFLTAYLVIVVLERTGVIIDLALTHNAIRIVVIFFGLYAIFWGALYLTDRFRDES